VIELALAIELARAIEPTILELRLSWLIGGSWIVPSKRERIASWDNPIGLSAPCLNSRTVKIGENFHAANPPQWGRVRASQSCLTASLENLHHIVIVHRSPFDFLSQTTLESCFSVDRIQREPSYQSEVLRTVEGTNAGFVFIKGHI
jgi:hypothetical protein